MKGETKERWLELCEQATLEQDTAKFMKIVAEINRELAQKQFRLIQSADMSTADGSSPHLSKGFDSDTR
ncbi:MAG TPA: hypothetical protein VH088_01450 [Terriglobales bacterium]|jgi:hypothetical protein|nr:hypothetical protein [Terriglobales bacterium]